MDIPGALTPEECMDEMDLDIIRDKAWHITLVTHESTAIPHFLTIFMTSNAFVGWIIYVRKIS